MFQPNPEKLFPKVKVVTECDVPQENTSLTVVIDEALANKNSKVAKIFTEVIAFPDLKTQIKLSSKISLRRVT